MWFIPLIKVAIPLIKVAAPWVTAYFVAKPIIEKWGSTPANDAKRVGLTSEQLFELQKLRGKDREKFLDDNNENIKKNNERLEEIEKNLTKIAEQINDENDPAEKAKLAAIVKDLNTEKKTITKENEKFRTDIKDMLKDFGNTPLTQTQFDNTKDKPNLQKWTNWGIIGFSLVLSFMLLKLVQGVFSKFKKDLGVS